MRLEERKRMAAEISDEGAVRLIIAIGQVRSKELRRAYRDYLKTRSTKNKDMVEKWERKLKRFPTELDDVQIKAIKNQVRKGEEYRCDY